MKKYAALYSLLALLFLYAAPVPCNAAGSLRFNKDRYKVQWMDMGKERIVFRSFLNIVYVAHPKDRKHQFMNVYVPEAYFEDKSIGNYNARTAPIFLPNAVKEYMPAAPAAPGTDENGLPNASLAALAKGYVVAAPALRGRTGTDKKGKYVGKAPASIVDLKAAVRYLRYNDKAMPGSAEKIVAIGSGAGGALSALLGAAGNSRDYESYLKMLGAANAHDNIFAAASYCPATDLDHADMAYEWQFGDSTGLTEKQAGISEGLKARFPAYVNALKLKDAHGSLLTLDKTGDGPFRDYVSGLIMTAAQTALDDGADFSALPWLTVQDGNATDMDFSQYAAHTGRIKTPPVFDALDLGAPENELFGTDKADARHFTLFSARNGEVDGSVADPFVIRLMNPLNYIGEKGATTAPYWYIRHGTADRNTSLAVPAILALKLENAGQDVDFKLPWGHSYNSIHDQTDLFAWMEKICK